MPIIRIAKRESPYVQIDRRPLEDASLSWRARGMLAYLLCKPDDWRISREHLIRQSPDGQHTVRETLRELEQARYLVRHRIYGDKGRFRWEHVLYEIPLVDSPPMAAPPVEDQPSYLDVSSKTQGYQEEKSLKALSIDGNPQIAQLLHTLAERKGM